MRNSRQNLILTALSLTIFLVAPRIEAQADTTMVRRDSVSVFTPRNLPAVPPSPRSIRWYHIGGGVGLIALSSLLDETLRDQLQDHRTSGKDDVARAFRHMGQPEVYGVVGLGTLAVGVLSGNDKVKRAGARISASLLAAGAVTSGLKLAVGRMRPNATNGAYNFRPFTRDDAWPSGHTTMAFALAASVSDEIRSLPVTIGLYGAATLTGWSRMNDNKHWLSDVLAGAAVGITSAKFMNGRWRVLGVGAPQFLLEPGGVGVTLKF